MFISQKEKDVIKRRFDNIHNNLNTLYEGKRQMNNLFGKDSHGTIRPKVDMLDDQTDHYLQTVWKNMNELGERISKLEKK